MDRPSIIWSNKAKIKLYKILEFYKERNKSNSFSLKLYQRINKEVRQLRDHPKIGVNTDFEEIKALIVDDFLIYYEFTKELIAFTRFGIAGRIRKSSKSNNLNHSC